ncbi:LysR family transcriptional regulator [Dryocola clanedunensis]
MHNNIDLSLLKVISTLVSCGSVTKTAEILNVSPGAISYSLNKARFQTGAHLFIRTRTGMKPDSTALELSLRYQKFNSSLTEKREAEPGYQRDALTFNTWSLLELMLASTDSLADDEPSPWRHVFRPYVESVAERVRILREGEIDIDIGSKLPADAMIGKTKLFTSKVAIVAGANNRHAGTAFTLDDWYNNQHAVWSVMVDYYTTGITQTSAALKHFNARKISVVSGSIINMLTFCAATDCIMIVPAYCVPILEKNFQLRSFTMPKEIEAWYDCFVHFNTQLINEPAAIEYLNKLIGKVNALYG